MIVIRLNDFETLGWETHVGTRTTIHARAKTMNTDNEV